MQETYVGSAAFVLQLSLNQKHRYGHMHPTSGKVAVLHPCLGLQQEGSRQAAIQAVSRLGSRHRLARCALARIITVWFVLGFLG